MIHGRAIGIARRITLHGSRREDGQERTFQREEKSRSRRTCSKRVTRSRNGASEAHPGHAFAFSQSSVYLDSHKSAHDVGPRRRYTSQSTRGPYKFRAWYNSDDRRAAISPRERCCYAATVGRRNGNGIRESVEPFRSYYRYCVIN